MGEEHDSRTWQLPLEQEMVMLRKERSNKRRRRLIAGALHKLGWVKEQDNMEFGLCRAPKKNQGERERRKGL